MQENSRIPICIKPPLEAYLERKGIFNFDKMVLGYAKQLWIHQHCPSLFKTIITDWEFSTNLETVQNDNFWHMWDKFGDLYLASGYRAEENSEEALFVCLFIGV